MEEAFRNIEATDVLEAVQQPVGVGGIAARLELPEPDEPRHAGVGRLFEQMLEVLAEARAGPARRCENLDRTRATWNGPAATTSPRRARSGAELQAAPRGCRSAWPHDGPLQPLRTAGAARQNMLEVRITTRSEDMAMPVVDCSPDRGDDPYDRATWRKAHPMLGVTITESALADLTDEAQTVGGDFERDFQRKTLNLPGASLPGAWLSLSGWQEGQGGARLPVGSRVAMGIDLAFSMDLCAVAMVAPPSDGCPRWRVRVFYWAAAGSLERRMQTDRAPYDDWRRQGWLFTCPGRVLDLADVAMKIGKLYDKWRPEVTGYDPAWAAYLADEISAAKPVVQSGRVLNGASVHFAELVTAGEVDGCGSPITTWQVQHAAADEDSVGRIRVKKSREGLRCDGVAATINAVHMVLSSDWEPGATAVSVGSWRV